MTTRFLVIGGQRCGTTFLHHLLEGHPDVAMAKPAVPEPKVFLSEELTSRGLEWYDGTFFAHATTKAAWGEKSTSYLECPSAAARAARVVGQATILAVLRDPVARAVSNWRFSAERGHERRPLAEALSAALRGEDPWDRTGAATSPFDYLRRSRYAELVEPWSSCFPQRLHLFAFDEVVSGAATEELFGTLGVDPGLAPPLPRRPVNASRRTEEGLPAGLERELREHFRPHDEALSVLWGRRPPWVSARGDEAA